MSNRSKTGRKLTGGSRKGIPNRVTSEMRDFVRGVLGELEYMFLYNVEELETDKMVDAYIKLLAFVLPKPQPVDTLAEERQRGLIRYRLPDLNVFTEEEFSFYLTFSRQTHNGKTLEGISDEEIAYYDILSQLAEGVISREDADRYKQGLEAR